MKKLPFAEKYDSRNPISRYLISRFISSLTFLVQKVAPRKILEIGCGEGFLALPLGKQGYLVHGVDIRKEAIEVALQRAQEASLQANLSFEVGNIYDIRMKCFNEDLLICCEVLEHLDSPSNALERFTELSSDYAIFSVPREPLWRILNVCRGKYLGTLGNTPGHVNHWSKNAFITFLKSQYNVLEVLSPIPWIMVLCKKA